MKNLNQTNQNALLLSACGLASALLSANTQAQAPSRSDLWDVSRGTTVVSSSALEPGGIDPRDALGGYFSKIFPGALYFSSYVPANSVHFMEWRTSKPVTISSFRVFAEGDTSPAGREFASFTLRAKSPGSPTFDLIVYNFVPKHPYQFIDPATSLLIDAQIPALTAQDFRAEFLGFQQPGWLGPRVIELDAFNGPSAPEGNLSIASVDYCWTSISNVFYQVQYASTATTNQWTNLGNPIQGNGTTNCITDTVRGLPQRFYRVLQLP